MHVIFRSVPSSWKHQQKAPAAGGKKMITGIPVLNNKAQ